RAAGDRLGLHVGCDHRGCAAGAREGGASLPGAPHAARPAALGARRGARQVPEGALPRDQPRPARARAAGPLPGGRAQPHAGGGCAAAAERARATHAGGAGPMTTTNGHRSAASDDSPVTLGRKDFTSDQEVRWCPGCGDYGILAALQLMLPELGIPPHEMVFVSGIGCAARLPYYMDTYGVHSIHGRAPALATGVAMTRPDLHVWVIGG